MKKILVVLILGILFANNVSAFEDDFQNHPGDLVTDVWTESQTTGGNAGWASWGGLFDVVQKPIAYTQSKSLRIRSYVNVDGSGDGNRYGTEILKINSDINPTYFSFVVREKNQDKTTVYDSWNEGVKYYNSTGTLLQTCTLTYGGTGLYEFIYSSGSVTEYYNGVSQGVICSFGTSPSSVAIWVYFYHGGGNDGSPAYNELVVDDISTSGIIGINNQYTELDTNIQSSFTTFAKYSHDYSYQMILRDSNGKMVDFNSSSLSYSGFVVWNISQSLGKNYGTYYLDLTRDGVSESTHWFLYSDYFYAASIQTDKQIYYKSDNAVVTYSISNYKPNNIYTIRIVETNTQIQISEDEIHGASGTYGFSANNVGVGDYQIYLTENIKCGISCLNAYDRAFDTFTINNIYYNSNYLYFTDQLFSTTSKTVFMQGDIIYIKGDNSTYYNMPPWKANAQYYFYIKKVFNGVNLSTDYIQDLPFVKWIIIPIDETTGEYTYNFYVYNISSNIETLINSKVYMIIPYDAGFTTPVPTSPPEPEIIPTTGQKSLIDIGTVFSEIAFGKLDSNENNEVSEKEIQTMGNKILPTLLFIVFLILIMGIFGSKKR